MRISESRKGLRVQLTKRRRELLTLPDGTMHPRHVGTIRSPKPIASRPPYGEDVCVYVIWDGMPTPEKWSLLDLEPHWLNSTLDAARNLGPVSPPTEFSPRANDA